MNINRISNETIAKLTWQEIGELDLCNHGVYTYHGILKTRKQGYKTVVTDTAVCFEKDTFRIEFVKIQQTSEEADYAMRVYDKERECYSEQVGILWGCEFFKH